MEEYELWFWGSARPLGKEWLENPNREEFPRDGGWYMPFSSRANALKAFNMSILNPNCDFAAIYDMTVSPTQKALWTFPSHWDGHL